jgi:hypothetical protein
MSAGNRSDELKSNCVEFLVTGNRQRLFLSVRVDSPQLDVTARLALHGEAKYFQDMNHFHTGCTNELSEGNVKEAPLNPYRICYNRGTQ